MRDILSEYDHPGETLFSNGSKQGAGVGATMAPGQTPTVDDADILDILTRYGVR